jgi:hypothetical protein
MAASAGNLLFVSLEIVLLPTPCPFISLPDMSHRPTSVPRSKIPVRRDTCRRATISVRISTGARRQKHAAIRGDFRFTTDEWFNVNQRIVEMVETVLSHDVVIQGPGPRQIEMEAGLGVALVAEIAIRPIKRICSLADPALQSRIRAMAVDPSHAEFRHTYLNGSVWFFFRILDPKLGKEPLGRHLSDRSGHDVS